MIHNIAFYVLWAMMGNDKYPLHNYSTEQQCIKAGIAYHVQVPEAIIYCHKWE